MESWKEFSKKIEKDQTDLKADWYGRFFVWKISAPITYLLVRTPISANQVTVIQEIIGTIGAIMLAVPSIKIMLLGIFLIQFGFILDCVDGEVARYKGQSSVRGVFLDLIGHQIVIPFYIFFTSLGVFVRTGQIDALVVGFLGALFIIPTERLALLSVINSMIEKKGNRNYSIDVIGDDEIQVPDNNLTIQKRNGWFWAIKKKWSYPDSMNMLTLFVITEYFFPTIKLWSLDLSPTYIFLYFFSIPVIIGRFLSFHNIFKYNIVEKHFHYIIRKILSD
jgi:phosphatidylglycerophosphate synthase|tara:strand:+ start:1264 stop:2097 length:834 start_codon:yes stop_codon:yes gene_type:complete